MQTDHVIEHSRADIVVLKRKKCLVKDVACPFATRISEKEKEKVKKIMP